MKIQFLGATKQVTGSMYLVQTQEGYNILIDCGYDLEKKNASDPLYSSQNKKTLGPYSHTSFPFEPSDIDVVILTHAHVDHSGRLPLLFRDGYEGQILCTTPTYHLTQILLEDSAHLHQKRFKKMMEKNKNKKKFPLLTDELYFLKQVSETMDRFVPIPLNQTFKINREISVTFVTAGHILGAAHVILKIKENGTLKTLGFSGDIGRKNYPLLPDPKPMPPVDYLVCESTYGNRLHQKQINPEVLLQHVIADTLIKKQGKLIVPAFSVGRTQALLFTLSKLYSKKVIPKYKVYSDSPMAQRSSRVYEKFVSLLNEEARDYFDAHDELFDFEGFEYVADLKKSKALSNQFDPCIIISSSGMIHGGRIEHHIKENIQNPKVTIAIVGYCAEGTIGHALMQGAKSIKIKNRELEVRCKVVVLDCFSAHGDQQDLISFVKQQNSRTCKNIFLTHGSEDAIEELSQHLQALGYQVVIPNFADTFAL